MVMLCHFVLVVENICQLLQEIFHQELDGFSHLRANLSLNYTPDLENHSACWGIA